MKKQTFLHPIREQWLEKSVELMTPHFENAGYKVPKVRVSCGWPSSGGLGKTHKTIGQCWAKEASSDGVHQIFISPWLEDIGETGVVPTLVHEVVHAVVGLEAKHGKVFRKCATGVGLDGKMTSTHAGKQLLLLVAVWQRTLGSYPHAKLDPAQRPTKKQTTRMIKMECGTCGYVARAAKKWIDEVGVLKCPKHGTMDCDAVPEKDDE